MLKIVVTGAGGRMGRTLIEACQQTENCQLTAAFERLDSSLAGADSGEVAGIGSNDINIITDIDSAVDSFDVMIDFTSIDSTLDHIETCKQHGKKIIIGTTGFSAEQKQIIENASKE